MKRILIDSYAGNIVAALADGKRLLEYQTEKLSGKIIVGSVFKGRVETVLPGMQAAFVNIGLEKNGYLYIGDSLVDRANLEAAAVIPTKLDLKVGDEILVQVVKDSSGTKGVRLTTHVSFAGRNLVYMPKYDFTVVSRRIENEEDVERLSVLAQEIKPQKGGLIVRTAASRTSKEAFLEERDYLVNLCEDIYKKAGSVKAPSLIYEDGNLAKRMLRDVYTTDVEEIVVGNAFIYGDVLEAASKRGESVKNKIKLFKEPTDLFTHYGLTGEVDKMLRNKVNLSSGAYINIDRTEALTVVDVNTGKYIGDDSLEKTVFETNLMAADEIARQLRLRNIGGIIIVDFIDMEEEAHRDAVVERLRSALKDDRSKCNVVGMTGLGLVEITRKKKRKESSSSLVKPCPYCKGDGVIFSNDYIVMRLRCALLDLFAQGYTCAIVDLNTEICDWIFRMGALSNDAKKIWSDKRIYLIPHKTFHQEFFIVKGENGKVLDISDKARLLY